MSRARRFKWASALHTVGDLCCRACSRSPIDPRPILHGPCGGLIHEEVREPDPVVQGPPWPPVTRRCDVCRGTAPEPVCQVTIYIPGRRIATAA